MEYTLLPFLRALRIARLVFLGDGIRFSTRRLPRRHVGDVAGSEAEFGFAAPVVLKRIVCGSCKISTCAYPRRWFAGWLGVSSGQIRKVPKAFELRLEVSKEIAPASLARQKAILVNFRYCLGRPLPRNGYSPVKKASLRPRSARFNVLQGQRTRSRPLPSSVRANSCPKTDSASRNSSPR
jgi:hypothetical protein